MRCLAILLCVACGAAPSSRPPPEPIVVPCAAGSSGTLESLCAAWRARTPGAGECELQPDGPPSTAGIELTILAGTHGQMVDRTVVVRRDAEYRVVGDLHRMFGLEQTVTSWVGVQRRELFRAGGRNGLLLEGVISTHEDPPCLLLTRDRRVLVVCLERGDGFACARRDLVETITSEPAGNVHPRSSQYDSRAAAECLETLRAAGFERIASPVNDRRETQTHPPRTASIVGDGVLRILENGHGTDEPLVSSMANAECVPQL
jgi:hypothetical protein